MTLNGLKGHFTLNFHYYELTLRVITYFFIVESVWIHVNSGDAEAEQRSVICRIFGIRGKLRIFRRRYIVGTLANKAHIYYLVPYRLSTDSKTRDLE